MAEDYEQMKKRYLLDKMMERHGKRLRARNATPERAGTIGSSAKNPVEDELNKEREENLFDLKSEEPASLRTLFEGRPAGTPFPSSNLPPKPRTRY